MKLILLILSMFFFSEIAIAYSDATHCLIGGIVRNKVNGKCPIGGRTCNGPRTFRCGKVFGEVCVTIDANLNISDACSKKARKYSINDANKSTFDSVLVETGILSKVCKGSNSDGCREITARTERIKKLKDLSDKYKDKETERRKDEDLRKAAFSKVARSVSKTKTKTYDEVLKEKALEQKAKEEEKNKSGDPRLKTKKEKAEPKNKTLSHNEALAKTHSEAKCDQSNSTKEYKFNADVSGVSKVKQTSLKRRKEGGYHLSFGGGEVNAVWDGKKWTFDKSSYSSASGFYTVKRNRDNTLEISHCLRQGSSKNKTKCSIVSAFIGKPAPNENTIQAAAFKNGDYITRTINGDCGITAVEDDGKSLEVDGKTVSDGKSHCTKEAYPVKGKFDKPKVRNITAVGSREYSINRYSKKGYTINLGDVTAVWGGTKWITHIHEPRTRSRTQYKVSTSRLGSKRKLKIELCVKERNHITDLECKTVAQYIAVVGNHDDIDSKVNQKGRLVSKPIRNVCSDKSQETVSAKAGVSNSNGASSVE